jgi:hypothetical protein
MDFFINSFMTVVGLTAGVLASVVLIVFASKLLPLLIMKTVCLLTTKKWQAKRYRQLIEKGQLDTAEWGKRYGIYTGE